VQQFIAAETIHAIEASLAFPYARAIHTTDGILYPVAMHTLFVIAGAEYHVTIFVMHGVERVLAVVAAGIEEID
jgi:hypothetical protein